MRRNSRARVLVVEDVDLEAKLLVRSLGDAGYSNIVQKGDLASSIAEVDAHRPRFIVADLELPDGTGLDLTKKLRAQVDGEYVYIIMLTSHGAEASMRQAFASGVDDFIVKPYRPDELVARLRAGERIVDLEMALRTRSRELEVALRRIDVSAAQRALAQAAKQVEAPAVGDTPLEAMAAANTWVEVESVLANSLTEFFQLPFVSAPTFDDMQAPFVAEVTLTEPTKQVELALSVVVDKPTMLRLALHLMGDEELEGAQALILEVGNVLMGVVKTGFIANGFTFTSGLPASVDFHACRDAFHDSPTRSRMAVANGESGVELWLRARETRNKKMRVRDLKEGLVLSEDLRDPRGVLMIKGGTRLTQSTADRLAKMVPDLEVEVTDSMAA